MMLELTNPTKDLFFIQPYQSKLVFVFNSSAEQKQFVQDYFECSPSTVFLYSCKNRRLRIRNSKKGLIQ